MKFGIIGGNYTRIQCRLCVTKNGDCNGSKRHLFEGRSRAVFIFIDGGYTICLFLNGNYQHLWPKEQGRNLQAAPLWWGDNSLLHWSFEVFHYHSSATHISFENHSLCAQFWELKVEYDLILEVIMRAFIYTKLKTWGYVLCTQSSKKVDTKWRMLDFQMLIVDKLLEVRGWAKAFWILPKLCFNIGHWFEEESCKILSVKISCLAYLIQ